MYNVGASQTTMYDVFTVVEMFTIVTIVKTSTTILPKNHNCCNSNHNCQNFLIKNLTSLIIILDQIMKYFPLSFASLLTIDGQFLTPNCAKFRKTVIPIDAVLRDLKCFAGNRFQEIGRAHV